MDAAFLYLENESTNAHGTFVWIYDAAECDLSAINRGSLREHMAQRMHVSPIFTRKIHRLPLDFDYPYWVDDEGFELLYHVRELSMPANGGWLDFCELVGQVHSRALDRNHPLSALPLELNLRPVASATTQGALAASGAVSVLPASARLDPLRALIGAPGPGLQARPWRGATEFFSERRFP